MAMALDREQLRAALSVLRKYEEPFGDEPFSYQWASLFLKMKGWVGQKCGSEKSILSDPIQELYMTLIFIQEDVQNIATIALRMNWLRDRFERKELSYSYWLLFVATDVDLLHVELRSAFDYLARAISLVSDNPGQVATKSFRELKQWLEKSNENANRLGQDLASMVLSCDWFDDIRFARDTIVHKGGTTIIEIDGSRILFRVDRRPGRSLNLHPETMSKPGFTDFELYAGLYLGYLLAYLERFSMEVTRRLRLEEFNWCEESYVHSGFGVVRGWIESAYKRIGCSELPCGS